MRRAARWTCIIALALAGCARLPEEPEPEPQPAPVAELVEQAEQMIAGEGIQAAAEVEKYVSVEPVIEPLAMTPAAEIASFEWTAEPNAKSVPEQGVTGRLHGRDFTAVHVSVSPQVEDKLPVYRLRFSSKPRGEVCGFSLDDDAVSVVFHEPLGTGEWVKPLADRRPSGGDAWYVIEQPDGVPLTCNDDFAIYLKIDELLGPTEANAAASMRGAIAICFNDDEKSWVAGRFAADGCR